MWHNLTYIGFAIDFENVTSGQGHVVGQVGQCVLKSISADPIWSPNCNESIFTTVSASDQKLWAKTSLMTS